MTVGTKRCIRTSICVPPRMRSNAVGGRLLNSSLAWDGAVMMPLQCRDQRYRELIIYKLLCRSTLTAPSTAMAAQEIFTSGKYLKCVWKTYYSLNTFLNVVIASQLLLARCYAPSGGGVLFRGEGRLCLCLHRCILYKNLLKARDKVVSVYLFNSLFLAVRRKYIPNKFIYHKTNFLFMS
jgi:hypothetical protein